jgi:thioesterase domain-containing protein/acyl carrier protein
MNPGICIPFMIENDITVLHVTPTQFRYFTQAGRKLETLKYLFLGAEKLSLDLAKGGLETVHSGCRVFNMYGPTEATIVSAVYEVKPEAEYPYAHLSSIPIGRPMANGGLLALDRYMNLCPVNIPGELHIAGDGVAAGYLNNPELTREKFIKYRSYWSYKTYILYKTGDLVRWLEGGNIEFLGRIDQQVKIRGFRIELGEIEAHLKTYPAIKEAVVIDGTDGERQYLCAYVTTRTPGQEILSTHRLKEHLEGSLPAYMIPTCFVKIDRLPLNPNGKVDLKALPRPMESDFHTTGEYEAPGTDIQRIIAETWKEALNREKVGIHDNFFDLGGNSLDFVKVSNKLKEKLDRDIPVATLFTYPTISSLERYLNSVELPVSSTSVPGNFVMLNGSPQSRGNIFFVHEILGDVGAYMEFCKQLGDHYKCWGVEAEKLRSYIPLNLGIEEIAEKYILQMKEIQPQGPYLLATWSWGGHLGLEMALQMERMGEKPAMLAFFDCIGPDCAIGKTYTKFTLETEKNFLRNFFIATGNEAELEKLNDLEQLWLRAVDVLTGDKALVEQLRQLLIENALALPDYDELTGEELIQYLNLSRTHSSASAHYIPVGKIHTPIHYFAANRNTSRIESWKDYCHNPVVYHEINGDHHSIFRNKEQIAEFARLFNEILENIVRLEKKEVVK